MIEMQEIVTKEQYICARDLIRNYKTNPDFKSCGIEYMDDIEKEIYTLALDQIYQYGRQIAAYKREIKKANQKG